MRHPTLNVVFCYIYHTTRHDHVSSVFLPIPCGFALLLLDAQGGGGGGMPLHVQIHYRSVIQILGNQCSSLLVLVALAKRHFTWCTMPSTSNVSPRLLGTFWGAVFVTKRDTLYIRIRARCSTLLGRNAPLPTVMFRMPHLLGYA